MEASASSLAGQPLGGGFLQAPLSGKVRLGKGLQDIGQAVPPGGDAQEHTVAVFGVVLKQGVGPGRSVAVLIDGVGGRGEEPPQMEEQPVALAIYIRSPKSWVISLA